MHAPGDLLPPRLALFGQKFAWLKTKKLSRKIPLNNHLLSFCSNFARRNIPSRIGIGKITSIHSLPTVPFYLVLFPVWILAILVALSCTPRKATYPLSNSILLFVIVLGRKSLFFQHPKGSISLCGLLKQMIIMSHVILLYFLRAFRYFHQLHLYPVSMSCQIMKILCSLT